MKIKIFLSKLKTFANTDLRGKYSKCVVNQKKEQDYA
jgi:hypothetical protein